ncbi:TonB-dependent receptor [Leptothrix discophora]
MHGHAQSPTPTQADEATGTGPVKSLGVVEIRASQPTSLPVQIPASVEGVDAGTIARTINATDSEDALKYLPSLLVRKRYIGDYNHAILSSRASGTGNSARSAVYGDGVLLSNFLGNGVGGLSFPPRWGLVTPEEIERVDVMYGPYSAAYPGNSVGAVVDYTTRMPTRFEAHAQVGWTHQPFKLYNTNTSYDTWQASAALGNQVGDAQWYLNVNRTDSEGQPLTFATRLVSSGTAGSAGTPVTGAVLDRDNQNRPWQIIGTGTQYHTVQDHLKFKLAYRLTPTLRAAYTFGLWQNTAEGYPASYLRDASGNTVSSGVVNIDGRSYGALTGGDFALTREKLTHTMHGLSLKSRTLGEFDWEAAASLYDYGRDQKRQNAASNTLATAHSGGAGTIADGAGTGWDNLALKGIWRPQGVGGAHIVEGGVQQERYQLSYKTANVTGNWLSDGAGAQTSDVGGETRLRSLWAQDVWSLAPDWKTVLGLRGERWQADQGRTLFLNGSSTDHAARQETHWSPKAALSWQAASDTVLKAAVGRALRMPTVAELYGATASTNAQFINDANLRPERSVTGELSLEQQLDDGSLRLTWFHESTRDAIYSQTLFDSAANRNISRVQNVGRVATQGVESVWYGQGIALRGLDLQASVTYADSLIKENAGFVSTAGDTLGKHQPNVARWRVTALASYRWNADWTSTLAVRHSGQQFRTLNNADVNGQTYQGVSPFTVADLRVRWQIDRELSAAFGIDNLMNQTYWNFHPYPQRSTSVQLKYDLR